jgi:alpha-L-fucosidase
MSITRRTALQWLAAAPTISMLPRQGAANQSQPENPGPYQPQWSSLQQHSCPDWYRDAKFGI